MNTALVHIEPCPIASEALDTTYTDRITGEQLASMSDRGHYELIKGMFEIE